MTKRFSTQAATIKSIQYTVCHNTLANTEIKYEERKKDQYNRILSAKRDLRNFQIFRMITSSNFIKMTKILSSKVGNKPDPVTLCLILFPPYTIEIKLEMLHIQQTD